MMLKACLLFAVGLVLLIKGGDWFVDGATAIAERFHVPELLIGATVVSIGTTIPEVMVSAASAVGGHSSIAYGNAIGSVICNTSLIAAITLAVRPGTVDRKTIRLPLIFFFAAAVFYAATAYLTGYFSRLTGIILLLGFVLYVALNIRAAKKTSAEEGSAEQPGQAAEHSDENQKTTALPVALLKLVAGAALIAVGADLLVDNGTLIAQYLGVPESVIALTFVALGTSLPELVTAITSLVKGHSDLSLGNVIGANLFNLVLVSGLAVTLRPFEVPAENMIAGMNSSLVVEIPVMLLVMLIMSVPAMVSGKTRRWQGILLLGIYIAFCIFQFLV